MTKREMTSLSLMLLGVYLLGIHLPFYGLALVGSLQSGRIATCIPPLLAFGFAISLITCSKQITQRILLAAGGEEDESGESDEPSPTLQTIAFSVVGLLLAAKGLPSLAGIINLNSVLKGDPTVALRYIGPMLEFVLGILIFFNGRRLSALSAKFNR
jgi:hypothetical protein